MRRKSTAISFSRSPATRQAPIKSSPVGAATITARESTCSVFPKTASFRIFFQLRPSICGHLQYKWHTGFPVQPLAEQRRHQKRSARAHTDRRRQYQRQQKTVFAPQQNRSHRREHREPSVARHHRVRTDRRQLLRPRRHDPAPRYPNCIASETHTHRQCPAAGGAAAGEKCGQSGRLHAADIRRPPGQKTGKKKIAAGGSITAVTRAAVA